MADMNMLPPDGPDEFRPESLLGSTPGGAYRLVRVLGIGGMATVYEAVRLRDGARCAFKMLIPEQASDPIALERFRREAEFGRRIKSPHAVEVLDYAQPAGQAPYLVMEYLDGEDLSERLLRLGKLEPELAVVVLDSVAGALTAAHEQKILHRDLKPANIYLAQSPAGGEVVKLLDFGASRVAGGGSQLTAMGMIIGTPWYVSPEQARGQELDARSDQFSLAIVLFEILTGTLPFDAVSPNEVLFKVVTDPTPSILSRDPTLPADLDPVFERALAKVAADRFPSVREFAQALRKPLIRAAPRSTAAGPVATPVSVPVPKARSRSSTGLSQSGPGRALKKADHRLLDLLHARGIVPFDVSRQLRNEGVPSGSNVLDYLVDQGVVDERSLLRALASVAQAKFLVTEGLRQMRIPLEALSRLPVEKARALQVLPLAYDAATRVLTVAVSDPDPTLIEKVRAASDVVRVQPALALPSAIAEVQPLRYELLPKPAPPTPSLPPEAAGLEPLGALLDRVKLDRAVAEARATSSSVLDCLLRLELLSEADVLRAFASAYRCRFIKSETLAKLDVPADVLRRVPSSEAERLNVLPGPSDPGELRLIVPIPLDPTLKATAQRWIGGEQISLYVATPAAANAAVRKAYRAEARAFTTVTPNGARVRTAAPPPPVEPPRRAPPPPVTAAAPPPPVPGVPVLKTMQVEALLLAEDPPLPPPPAVPVAKAPTGEFQPATLGPRSGELKPIAAGPRSGEVKPLPARSQTGELKSIPPKPLPAAPPASSGSLLSALLETHETAATAIIDVPAMNEILASASAPPVAELQEGEGDVLVLCLELRGIHGAQTVPSREAANALTALLAKAAGWVEDAGGVIESTRFDELVALWPAQAPSACRRALAVAFRLTAHASSLWVEGRPLTSGVGVHVGRARIARPGHGELAALGPAAAVARELATLSSGPTVASMAVLNALDAPIALETSEVDTGKASVPARRVSAPAGALSLDL